MFTKLKQEYVFDESFLLNIKYDVVEKQVKIYVDLCRSLQHVCYIAKKEDNFDTYLILLEDIKHITFDINEYMVLTWENGVGDIGDLYDIDIKKNNIELKKGGYDFILQSDAMTVKGTFSNYSITLIKEEDVWKGVK